jgi:hypothetical protein
LCSGVKLVISQEGLVVAFCVIIFVVKLAKIPKKCRLSEKNCFYRYEVVNLRQIAKCAIKSLQKTKFLSELDCVYLQQLDVEEVDCGHKVEVART